MRRILGVLLLLVFALPLVAPALGQTAQKKLLLCCLKGGAHHCTDAAAQAGPSGPAMRSHCPAWDNPAATGYTANWMDAGSPSASSDLAAGPLGLRQVEEEDGVALDRTHPQRGPPVASSL
jgi:hypothetical protein